MVEMNDMQTKTSLILQNQVIYIKQVIFFLTFSELLYIVYLII